MSRARDLADVWRRHAPSLYFGLRRNDDGGIAWPFYFILALAAAIVIGALARAN